MSTDTLLSAFLDELQKIAAQEVVRQGTLEGVRSGLTHGPKGAILGGVLGAFRAKTRNETLHKRTMRKTAAWGKNVGRSWGRSSTKGGWATKYRSAGMSNPKPSTKKMPRMPGSRTLKGSLGAMPKPVAETNNQVTLRRGLSNIELPEPR